MLVVATGDSVSTGSLIHTLLFGLNYFFLSLIVFPVCMNMCGQMNVEGSKLILENVMPSDGGLYSCTASNTVGTATEDFQLISKALLVASVMVIFFSLLVFLIPA